LTSQDNVHEAFGISLLLLFISELFRKLISQLWWTAPRHCRWRLTLVRSPTSRVRCQLGRTYNKLIGWDQALYRQRTRALSLMYLVSSLYTTAGFCPSCVLAGATFVTEQPYLLDKPNFILDISKSGKFRFGHVATTDLSQPFDGLTTARSYM